MIKVTLTNDILKKILSIEENRFSLSTIELPVMTKNKLRKNSKKKSSYASNKIEGNPLTEQQADEAIERDELIWLPEKQKHIGRILAEKFENAELLIFTTPTYCN